MKLQPLILKVQLAKCLFVYTTCTKRNNNSFELDVLYFILLIFSGTLNFANESFAAGREQDPSFVQSSSVTQPVFQIGNVSAAHESLVFATNNDDENTPSQNKPSTSSAVIQEENQSSVEAPAPPQSSTGNPLHIAKCNAINPLYVHVNE